jgi:Spy/CpxP family protein refolding chaperone
MRKHALALVALALIAPAQAADAQAAQPTAAPTPTTEQVLEQFKTDLQAKRADLMAKNMTLTADQAAKFWPLYDQFQKEQDVIMDEQAKAVEAYANAFATLTDADSQAFVKAQLDRDARMTALRLKWLTKFQTVLPGGLAARVIQIDRRIGQIGQAVLSSQLPLVH